LSGPFAALKGLLQEEKGLFGEELSDWPDEKLGSTVKWLAQGINRAVARQKGPFEL
jgi:hypothetical protein